MRVAHCIHGLRLGGAQQVIRNLVSSKIEPTLRYFVYCSLDGPMRPAIEAAGAEVRVIPRQLPKVDPLWVSRLARALREDRIDLLHSHLFGDTLHGYLATRWADRIPAIATLHSRPDILSGYQQRAYRWLVSRLTQVVACSEPVRAAFQEEGLDVGRRIQTIPNGIDFPVLGDSSSDQESLAATRQKYGIDPQAVVFASIGRLSPEKGLDVLLRAFAQTLEDLRGEAELLVVGEGDERLRLEGLASELGCSHKVRFTGYISDIPALLMDVDVVVLSSLSEGLPITLLEAMAAGRGIVATSLPGILEAVRPDREALIVPSGDSDSLSRALTELAENPELRKVLGDRATSRFRDRFTAAAMVTAYEALYYEIVGS